MLVPRAEKEFFLGARFTREDAGLVKRVSRLRGEDVSDFLRRAVRRELARLSFLDPETRRALEVSEEWVVEGDAL